MNILKHSKPVSATCTCSLIPRTDQETFILGWSGSGDDTKGWEGNERGWGRVGPQSGGGAYMFPPPQPKILHETLKGKEGKKDTLSVDTSNTVTEPDMCMCVYVKV